MFETDTMEICQALIPQQQDSNGASESGNDEATVEMHVGWTSHSPSLRDPEYRKNCTTSSHGRGMQIQTGRGNNIAQLKRLMH